MEIKINDSYTSELVVTPEKTAMAYGSGMVEVLATPAMIAMMENTAQNVVSSNLPDGSVTVGTLINVSHVRATPVGMKVTCTATLVEINGRELKYTVEARDEKGLIGEGAHIRFIVDKERFMNKLA